MGRRVGAGVGAVVGAAVGVTVGGAVGAVVGDAVASAEGGGVVARVGDGSEEGGASDPGGDAAGDADAAPDTDGPDDGPPAGDGGVGAVAATEADGRADASSTTDVGEARLTDAASSVAGGAVGTGFLSPDPAVVTSTISAVTRPSTAVITPRTFAQTAVRSPLTRAIVHDAGSTPPVVPCVVVPSVRPQASSRSTVNRAAGSRRGAGTSDTFGTKEACSDVATTCRCSSTERMPIRPSVASSSRM
ncbi:MAG: hypothetical protein QOF76_2320 [Solirubrobacteraceae bacterium]|nr:hypothetical protein [Solirubrobacteraceae bacterium]